jgi:GLPGLI family protein
MNRFTILIFLTLSFYAQGQKKTSGTVSYKASYIKDYMEVGDENSKEIVDKVNESIKNAKNVTGILKFNSNESSYSLSKQLEVDNAGINLTYYFAGQDNLFYYHKDLLYLVDTNTTLGKPYKIIRESPNWTVTKETKHIDELLCVKAYSKTLDDKIEAVAWFCPNIPVSYGPAQFYGLPGLIIELQFSKIIFIAEKLVLNQENVLIKKPEEAPKVTPEEFMAIAKKRMPSYFEN